MRTKIIMISLIIALIFTSCATSKNDTVTVTEVEYVQVEIDISDSLNILYSTRPSDMIELPEQDGSLQSIYDTIVAYKEYGEDWHNYSVNLEQFLNEGILEAIKPSEAK